MGEIEAIGNKLIVASDVDEQMQKEIFKFCLEKPNGKTIYFSTDGGGTYTALAIHDFLRALKKPPIIIGCGLVASSGIWIMSGVPLENRLALENTTFLIHSNSVEFEERMRVGAENEFQQLKKVQDRMQAILEDRLSFKKGQLSRLLAKESYFDVTQAIEYGLIYQTIRCDET